MKPQLLAIVALVTAFGLAVVPTGAQEVLTGDTRLACEAVLCLSSGDRPSECQPSLERYFSIKSRKLKDTIRKRANFLKLCPSSNQTPEMASLVEAQANAAGRCDVRTLNTANIIWEDGNIYISDQMPDYCAAYVGHAYTDFNSSGTTPRYVGTPENGGYWVEEKDYEDALAEYNERLEREREERERALEQERAREAGELKTYGLLRR